MLQTADISLTLLNVGLARHKGDWNWRNVRSPFARIYCVTEGTAQVVLPHATLSLRPGRLYLIPPYVTHHYVNTGLFTHYYIHLYEQHDPSQPGVFDELDIPYEVEARSYDVLMAEQLHLLMPHLALEASNPETYDNHEVLMERLRESQEQPLGIRMEAKGIMQQFLSRFVSLAVPRQTVQDDRISQAVKFINQHLDRKISMDRLAAETCLSKDHFIRLFKQTTGETPGSYITRKKLEQAELLLLTTNDPVKHIATLLGFDDTSYFVRLFRQHVGMAPQHYRQGD